MRRLSFRLLVFNLLVLLVPATALMILDTYETQLLRALEHALAQQARVLAAALSGPPEVPPEEALRVLRTLGGRHEARIRVVGPEGALLADSSRLGPTAPETEAPAEARPSIRARPLYALLSAPLRVARRFGPPSPPLRDSEFYSGAERLLGPEVREALAGRYGAATRISSGGQRSVTLYSAIPIVSEEGPVTGVALVSQSTFRILGDLYELRLDVARIFALAVLASVVLSLFVASTVTRPLHRLRDQALGILDRRGRIIGPLPPSRRKDEIGDLSRSLSDLTGRLSGYVRFAESMASEVAHEMKNPLASTRAAVELVLDGRPPAAHRRLLESALADVARAESLLGEIRELSRLETGIDEPDREEADLARIARNVVEGFRLRGRRPEVTIRLEAAPEAAAEAAPEAADARATVRPEQVVRALENVIDNALDFSPPGGEVVVEVCRRDDAVLVTITDRGPGVPEESLSRVFDRFYCDRPAGRDGHSGLGLAIVKSVLEAHGGEVSLRRRQGGGTTVRLRFPAAGSIPGGK